MAGVNGCKDLTGSPGLPAGTPNPSSYNNKDGAIGMRNAAILQFVQALPQYIVDTGLLTDELEDINTGASVGTFLETQGVSDPLDERILPEGSTIGGVVDYGNLQGVREFANQAIGALATYDTAAVDTATAKALRGELYALEGESEILLADFFCSGVPLSTLDYGKDFTYHASLTRAQVDSDALAKLDTALTLSDTSSQVLNLARVGRGRAWLDLGNYDSAATAVAQVPQGFQYIDTLSFFNILLNQSTLINEIGTVSDSEGINGLPYRSSDDPRTGLDTTATTTVTSSGVTTLLPMPLTIPAKYGAALSNSGYAPFVVADWIEARLIQAEDQLQPASAPNGPWLTTLNALRATVPGLHQLSDPGVGLSGAAATNARVSLLFHERAFWLFLTGHRQGDLRRLIRQYGRPQQTVYPTGTYRAPGTGLYGSAINVPIPLTEYANPDFHGCIDHNA